jgi:hypothetical protein
MAWSMYAQAQHNRHVLTIKEAELLALNAPLVLHPAQGNCCPDAYGYETLGGTLDKPYRLITVQVRCSCGESGGQLIGNYVVNPATGMIWEGLDDEGKVLHSKRLDALRNKLLASK